MKRSKTTPGRRTRAALPLRSAFSLVELSMVVVIMGTLSGIAIPRFANTIANQRANAIATRITTDLARAQKAAKFSSTSQTLRFSTVLNSYQILAMKDIDHPAQTYTIKLGEPPYKAKLNSVNFGGDNEVIFNGFGIADSGGTVSVQVGPFTKVITLDGTTNQVTTQ